MYFNIIILGIDLGDEVSKWLSDIILGKPEGILYIFFLFCYKRSNKGEVPLMVFTFTYYGLFLI